MASHFHTLTVKDVKKETADCVSVAFHIPDELKTIFQFIHGQNITLKTIINNEEIRRSYSICSSPFENEVRVAIKKADKGIFSTYANEQLQKGQTIDVLPPTGKFYTTPNSNDQKNYLAFAAGSGITPVISIIKTILAVEKRSTFTLVYGNRTRNSIIFFEELEALKNKYMDRFNLIHILSRERSNTIINNGRIDKEKLELLNHLIHFKSMDEIFICGPQEMLFCIKDFLEENGIEKNSIHFELFTSSEKIQRAKAETRPVIEKNNLSNVTIISDGRQHEFSMPYSGESILDAALTQGIDLPFACKGGMCCSCKALIKKGEVSMDVNWGLDQEELDKNFILTCQAHPTTTDVIIDYDIK